MTNLRAITHKERLNEFTSMHSGNKEHTIIIYQLLIKGKFCEAGFYRWDETKDETIKKFRSQINNYKGVKIVTILNNK